MINLEHKLTVDDLIVEYMIYKVTNGYEPSFSGTEFMNFLYYFEDRMPVEDSIHESQELFNRFFKRMCERNWSIIDNFTTGKITVTPHMEMKYSDTINDYIISANYKLSNFDKSVINTYYMDNGMSKFDHFKGTAAKVREIIGDYLNVYPKRKIDDTIKINNDDLSIGKYVTAEIILQIWDSFVDDNIRKQRWPRQCRDINKYLFDVDLASIIELSSIKNELIKLYDKFSRRIAIMYQSDKNLKISSSYGSYLARANYELLISGYEEIMQNVFSTYKKNFEIDLSSLTFKNSQVLDNVSYWDDDCDVITTTDKIGNDNVKRLVKKLDNN